MSDKKKITNTKRPNQMTKKKKKKAQMTKNPRGKKNNKSLPRDPNTRITIVFEAILINMFKT